MTEQNDTSKEPGFTIKDRRIGTQKSTEESSAETGGQTTQRDEKKASSAREERKKVKTTQEIPLPEINFGWFIISLSTSAYMHLGDIPDPVTNENNMNLTMAKQTIDIISMLKEKTEGNRTPEEDTIINDILYNLRMAFVAVSNKA